MTTKFNAEIKAEWVAALRSGNYAQIDGQLYYRPTDSFCCLGVLRHLHPDFKEDTGHLSGYLDSDICGLSFEIQDKLASLNDAGVSFADIADIIEKEVPTCTT